jgi:hypothetical protein
MRDRFVEFLPLVLALGLVAVWFGIQPPIGLPFLSSKQDATQPAVSVVPSPTSTPGLTLSRAAVIQSLCDPKEPQFLGTLASLKARLGSIMGNPIDCERAVNSQGDTEQQTTTGLAYYRRKLNIAAFTTGWDHWALNGSNLLRWGGPEVEPPDDATAAP